MLNKNFAAKTLEYWLQLSKFKFFAPVPNSPNHKPLICVKNRSRISHAWAPLKHRALYCMYPSPGFVTPSQQQQLAPFVLLNGMYYMIQLPGFAPPSYLSISSSMLHMCCCTVCTVWPQLPGHAPPSKPSAAVDSFVLYCCTIRTQLPGYAPPSYPSAAACFIRGAALCVLCDLSYLDLRLPASH